ncbi:MAG: hypothetical protein AB1432_12510 [Bacteroidota bacterium]
MIVAGTHTADITPKTSVDLNGYILRFGKSQGIHDPLKANFFYIESGKEKMLLASLDILTISSETANKLRNEISIQLKMKKEAIILAAIHTHSAVGSPYLRNVGEESGEWLEDFEKKIVDGCKIARNSALECELYSYEAYSSVGINRRNPSRGIDPYVPFIVARKNSEITAMMINYNCHPVCLTESNLLISADYINYLRDSIYQRLDQHFPILFFNGGSGDVDPKCRGSFEDAKYTGSKLADEILLSLQAYKGERLSDDMYCKSASMRIPYDWQPTVEEAEENLEIYSQRLEQAQTKEEEKTAKAFYLWASDVLEQTVANTLPKSIDIDITSLSIGKAMFLAVPLEIFSSISLKLRKRFGNNSLFVISYGNGYSGYLSDKAAHVEGGYEIDDWHKYAGILPKVPYIEDIFWESINKLGNK